MRPPVPPFTAMTAMEKVQAAEDGQWWRSYGNEMWDLDAAGLMTRREASINDVPVDVTDRRLFRPRNRPDTGKAITLQ